MRPRFLLALCAMLALAAPALGSEYSDFRIPAHRWSSLAVAFSGGGSRRYGATATSWARNVDLQTDLFANAQWGLDSDPLSWSLVADAATVGSRSSQSGRRQVSSPVQYEDKGRNQGLSESARLFADLKSYPWRAPFGISFGGSIQPHYDQHWSLATRLESGPESGTSRRTDRRFHDSRNGYLVSLSISPGFGRVRDATVVYQVQVLEERLRGSGALSRPLSAATRTRLAALYYVRPRYSAPHDRPERFFWRDVEKILVEDGALAGGGLDAYGVLWALEPVVPRTLFRRKGFFVGPTIARRYGRDHFRDDFDNTTVTFVGDTSSSSSAEAGKRHDVLTYEFFSYGGVAEYHEPLGRRVQLDLSHRTIFQPRKSRRHLDSASSASLIYQIADRFEARASLSHQRRYLYQRLPRQQSQWAVGASAGLSYYVEDHLALSLGFGHAQEKTHAPQRRYRRDEGFSLGLTFHALGALDAGALIDPVRRLSAD